MSNYDQVVLIIFGGFLITLVTKPLLEWVYDVSIKTPTRKIKAFFSYLFGYRLIDGVIIHTTTLNRINKLEKTVESLKHQINYIRANPVKREKTGQLRFETQTEPNGNRPSIQYPIMNPKTGKLDVYYLVFNNDLDRMKFTRPEEYIWIERGMPKIGKREPQYKKMWIRTSEFDSHTDVDILKHFPYTSKSHTKYIPDHFLPFKIIETEETAIPLSYTNGVQI